MDKWIGGLVCNDGRRRSESGSDIEVYQTAVLFRNGFFVFPAQSGVQSEAWVDSEVVVDESIPYRLAEIFVGVAEGDRTCVGYARRKIPEGGAGDSARESERSPRVLLRQVIELLPAEVGTERNVVTWTAPQCVPREA